MATSSTSTALASRGPSFPSCASARLLTGLFSFVGESVGEREPIILCGKARVLWGEARAAGERTRRAGTWERKGEGPREALLGEGKRDLMGIP